ncbi:MAG: hypothetical protein ACE5GE_06835 [Phycisphaerae bacterium]
MKNRTSTWICLALLGCVFLAGGCIDAVGEGVTGGIRVGVSELVSTVLLDAARNPAAGG